MDIVKGQTYIVDGPVNSVMVGTPATVLGIYDDVVFIEFYNSSRDRAWSHVRHLSPVLEANKKED